ncbi:MAG: AsnC family transcriptional regulator [Ignavibacteria bacterium CG_4_8_14_3_um_filter_37_9]|nr:Lrp/AsnC family transcriptional regulator [Ignavibacteria bacterium]PIP78938.1 MAG: AsnC family transcriptional regulator [Ignavibacteria bacterium CG22_combo_CG10-13_8_21_14_all_37_15]PIS44436.1 MAG: AsnC family transcriptional regulator [Ignavibacteria bacterium CG08_land_8_20_14_0_20_37_9]PIW99247.1 MAG: AsnC family transcriptional regulator [Ignavibacteria bacterium CG_4_8_14_3_um_filter_37_9]PJC57029.1 MAG: AsnC family transcriptional regulator [Ignavibacteria bacterium CG_4_9_14_0_2_um
MIDNLDIKILEMLQEQGRTKRNQLAEAVGMSIPSVSERLHKLEDKKIIENYYTKINRKAFGYDIMAFILLVMDSSKHYKILGSKVEQHPAVLECHSILGEGSHILKVIAKNTEALEKLLAEIQSWPGVVSTKTFFVLTSVKESTKIALK